MFRLRVDLLLLLLLLFLLVFLARERERDVDKVRKVDPVHFFRQLRPTKQTETSRTTRARSNFSGPARFFFYIDIFYLESQFLSILEISFLNSFQFSKERFSFHLSTRDEIRNFSPNERKRERELLSLSTQPTAPSLETLGAREMPDGVSISRDEK